MGAMETLTDYFTENGLRIKHGKGTVLYAHGDPLHKTMLICNGLVKIYDTDTFGNERTVSIFGPGNIIPIVWLLEEQKEVLFYYQALSDVETYAVNTKDILAFIRTQPEILMFLLGVLTKAYLNQDARVYSLQRTNIRERLDFALYYLAHRVGKIDGTIAKLPGNITHTELANLTGVTRESVSRELAGGAANGLIWKDDTSTYVDLSKLKNKNLPPVFRM